MRVRGVGGLLAVFTAGVVVGAWSLHALPSSSVSASEAQRRALVLLEKPALLTSIGDNKIVTAVRRIAPAVVNIDTIGRVKQQDENGKAYYVEQEAKGKGSGVVLSPDGYIVTNDHVIDGASRIRVTFSDGEWRFGQLVGRDQNRDLAVLRVDRTNLTSAQLGDSDHLQIGESVIAVGNPMGLGSSVSSGIVSALNRRNLQIDDAHNLEGAIQTDAAINRGNSGGALANVNGQLIGINTAILSAGAGGGSIGLGFALPINTVRKIVRGLIADGKSEPRTSRKPWLGVEVDPRPENISLSLGLPDLSGAKINRVLPETPASLAGLAGDDIILRIDGKRIQGPGDIDAAMSQHKTGEHAIIRIFRPRERCKRDIRVVVQEHPDSVPLTP